MKIAAHYATKRCARDPPTLIVGDPAIVVGHRTCAAAEACALFARRTWPWPAQGLPLVHNVRYEQMWLSRKHWQLGACNDSLSAPFVVVKFAGLRCHGVYLRAVFQVSDCDTCL